MSSDNPSILILRPTGRAPTVEHLKSSTEFITDLVRAGWEVHSLFSDLSSIGHNRDQLARFFVDSKKYAHFDYALWVDDDMCVPGLDMKAGRMRDSVDAMKRLIRGVEKDGVGISSTVAVCRRAPFRIAPQLEAGVDITPMKLMELTERGGFTKAARVGMAFTLVSREVYKAIPFPWYRPTVEILEEWDALKKKVEAGEKIVEGDLRKVAHRNTLSQEMGEDYLFCDRAAAAGFSVEIDWGTWTGHEFDRVAYPSLYIDTMRRRAEQMMEEKKPGIVVAH